MARTIPGSGAVIKPIFNEVYGVRAVKVLDGGEGYTSSDPPRLTVTGCGTPVQEALLYPIIDDDSGRIIHVRVLESGSGYDPLRLSIVPEQETPNVVSSFDINRLWQRNPNSQTTGAFSVVNDDITDRLRIVSDNHPKPSEIAGERVFEGGSITDRSFDQTFIYRGGKDTPDAGDRADQRDKSIGIMSNGVLLHTPEWGVDGGAPTNFNIDSVKYSYLKNNDAYDGVTENSNYFYQSSRLINHFATRYGVFENGLLKQYTWRMIREAGNFRITPSDISQLTGNIERGIGVVSTTGNGVAVIAKVVRDSNNNITDIYIRSVTNSFSVGETVLGSNGFTFTIDAITAVRVYYINFGENAAEFGNFQNNEWYLEPGVRVKANQQIIIDQSDPSNQPSPSPHPVQFSTTPNGAFAGGTLYYDDPQGAPVVDYSDQYRVTFIMSPNENRRIYYYCKNHGSYHPDQAYIELSAVTDTSPRPNNYYTTNFFSDGSSIDYSRHANGHSKILGMSFDGYPIYGPYGYTNPYGLSYAYTVTVNAKTSNHPFYNQGSANGYYLIGGDYTQVTEAPSLTFIRGATYTFNQDDATNASHAIYFAQLAATYGGNDRYETGVTYTLDGTDVDYATYSAGFAAATNRRVSITVAIDAPATLYYTCQAHQYMGAPITVTANSNFRMVSSYRLKTGDEFEGTRPKQTTTGTVNYAVTVVNNQFNIDGSVVPFLQLDRGKTYVFNMDNSSNDDAIMLISATEDGWHPAGATAIGTTSYLYENGVTYHLDGAAVTYAAYVAGFNGATTREMRITPRVDSPRLLYIFAYNAADYGFRIVQDGYLVGDLVQDYIYDSTVGNLDAFNGKFAVTPEYPNGTYAYFMTEDSNGDPVYPYVIGPQFYGVPIFEGDTVPDLVQEFPAGAEGEIILNENGSINYVRMTRTGDGYFGPTSAKILGGEGSGAIVNPTVQTITGLTLLNPGRSFATPPTLIFEGGGEGQGARGAAEIDTNGRVTRIDVVDSGEFYESAPFVLLSGGGGSGAKAVARIDQGNVVGIDIVEEGRGYTNPPSVIFTKLVNLKRRVNARQANNSTPAYLTGLLKSLTASDDTIYVDSTDAFPGSGELLINNETIRYASKSRERFTGVTRGINFNYDQRVVLDTINNDQEGVSTYEFNVGDQVIRRVENANNKIAKVYDWNPNNRELLVTFEVDELAFIDAGIPSTEDAIVQFDAGVAASAASGFDPHILLNDTNSSITLLTEPISVLSGRKFEDDDENEDPDNPGTFLGDGIPDLVNTGTDYANQINLDGGIYNSLYGIEETQGGQNTTLFQVGDSIKDAAIPTKFATIVEAGQLSEGRPQTALVTIYVDGNNGNGANYQVNETVTGSASNVTGTVVAWDNVNGILTVSDVTPYNTNNINVGVAGYLYKFSEDSTIVDFIVQNPGSDYSAIPSITIENAGDVLATGTAVMTTAGDQVASVTVTAGGYGYEQSVDGTYNSRPTVTVTNDPGDSTGSGAVIQAIVGGENVVGQNGASYRIKRIEYQTIVRSE